MEKAWLVEIRVKDWVHVIKGESRVVTYEEVLAVHEVAARHAGFDQFERRSLHDPIIRRLMMTRQLTLADCCAPDAVEIDI
ncbi:hypothetical protein [Burkholderia ubonensis]|uniref:hypothetical protein n=1 Tax=Burkholderia ubonensis TaxID=101571 RepID=UPI000A969C9A|nr:hypothetical protein [Burkholderia ubonensis]